MGALHLRHDRIRGRIDQHLHAIDVLDPKAQADGAQQYHRARKCQGWTEARQSGQRVDPEDPAFVADQSTRAGKAGGRSRGQDGAHPGQLEGQALATG